MLVLATAEVQPLVRARALTGAAWLAYTQVDYDAATELALEAESITGERDAGQRIRGFALNTLAMVAMDRSNYDDANQLLDRVLVLRRELNEGIGIGVCLNNWAWWPTCKATPPARSDYCRRAPRCFRVMATYAIPGSPWSTLAECISIYAISMAPRRPGPRVCGSALNSVVFCARNPPSRESKVWRRLPRRVGRRSELPGCWAP